ncbi:MAG TPA: hypothetical protein VM347_11560 [Nonomuraea sp.]|nr:hypothetical protein [Nonomuraea sp.]
MFAEPECDEVLTDVDRCGLTLLVPTTMTPYGTVQPGAVAGWI